MKLYNPTDAAADVSDWQLAGANPLTTFRLPAGTVIPANAYLVVDESQIPLGLGPVSQAHVFGRFNVQVDTFAWQTDPATTYGRCPDGTGGFVVTAEPSRGAANRCAPEGRVGRHGP